MGVIVINSNSKTNLKLIKALAKQLGDKVNDLSPGQAEDLQIGMLIRKEKTGKEVSREAIFKLLDAR